MEVLLYIVVSVIIGAIIAIVILKSGKKEVAHVSSIESEELREAKDCIVKLQLELNRRGNNDSSSNSDFVNEIEKLKAELSAKEAIITNFKSNADNNNSGIVDTYQSEINNLKVALKETEAQAQKSSDAEQLAQESLKASEEKLVENKAKIKKLEDDLEELEEDLDDQKKKTKKVEQERNEAQEELERANKENKQISIELNNTKESLVEAKQQISINNESLSFVQEVMTAKRADDKSYNEKLTKITELESYIKEDFANFITENIDGIKGTDIWNQYFGPALSEWKEIASKHWIQGKVKIAFVGEFSAGKTSIVNRILSQDDPNIQKLPVSTKATTAIPTYISGGPATMYNFYSPDNVLKSISQETFNRVNKEVLDQVQGVSSLIKYFVMSYKNPNLNGMSILDTPGFNSNDSEDKERTLGVINECDALFWVVDVNSGTVNRSSLSLIKNNLTKPLYVVINKVDTKADSEVDKVEELVRNTFEKEGVRAQGYLRFSGKAPLNTIMDVVKSVPRDTRSEAYITSLAKEFIPQIIKAFNDDVKEKNNRQQSLRQECERLEQEVVDALNSVIRGCENAGQMPQRETHFFGLGDDTYEMTEDQYNKFMSILNRISKTDSHMAYEKFQESTEAYRQYQSAIEELAESNSTLAEMKKHQKRIESFIREL